MERSESIHYSIVIPVFNTSIVLKELVQRIEQVFNLHVKKPFEIILVDDGSANLQPWPALEELVEKNEYITVIRLARNFGQHAAMVCGIEHTNGRFLLTMDDDLQHAPEDIPVLISQQDHDVVMGQFEQKKHNAIRNFGSNIKSYFDSIISGKPQNLRVSTFCLIQRHVAEKMLANLKTPLPLFSTLLFQATSDIVGVAVSHTFRSEGKSGYSIFKLVKIFIRLFVSKSTQGTKQEKPYIIRQGIHQPKMLIRWQS
jgi:dolichol-phosphate mannosyltransferase/undecaprenyl-phosphate 4-deoxy-4-formamido-L-arabinose transferase